MADSLQKWVGRNRPPRVQITYDVEIGDAVEKKELPMVVGLLADLSGQPATPLPKLKDRRLVEIDRDNFNEIMGKISPRLDMSVPDTMKGEGNLKIELNFKEFDDFHPEAIVKQVPRLAKLLQARQELRDLLAKLDGNDELDGLLEGIIANTEDLKALQTEANAGAEASTDEAAPAA
ncbi:MAG: type VI secretion system contractile sheath small subunit [Ramlibacter sp.]|nr:type VI secretion system contractile sheath small subunit [Ramlibacter sp.]MCW5651906.1 type VI secretion system contractile sheath small subunit [Ramlibacter sp.]